MSKTFAFVIPDACTLRNDHSRCVFTIALVFLNFAFIARLCIAFYHYEKDWVVVDTSFAKSNSSMHRQQLVKKQK